MIDSYAKLPIGKYLELCRIDPALPDIDRQVEMVSILTDIPADDLFNMPVTDYSALAVKTGFLGEELPQPQERVMKEYRLGDFVLVPHVDVRKMTTAQFVDFQAYVKDPDKYFVEILTVFLIPKGCKYNNGYDVMQVRDVISDNLSILLAQDLRAFFFGRCRDYAKAIQIYLTWQARKIRNKEKREEMKKLISQAKTNFKTAGDGFAMLMQCQRPADAAGMTSGIWP